MTAAVIATSTVIGLLDDIQAYKQRGGHFQAVGPCADVGQERQQRHVRTQVVVSYRKALKSGILVITGLQLVLANFNRAH